MIRPLRVLPAIAFLLVQFAAAIAADWHHPLSLDGGGYWQRRIRLVVQNRLDTALLGRPVTLPVGAGEGLVDLAGQAADSVRLVDSQGVEMLWAIRSADGNLVTRGPIPPRASLVLPAECPPTSSAVYYIYFDNPAAGPLPDFLLDKPGTAGDAAGGMGAVAVRADNPERLSLQQGSPAGAWLDGIPATIAPPDRRLVVRVYNFSDKPIARKLASVEISPLVFRSGSRPALYAVLMNEQRRQVPYSVAAQSMLFEATVPAHAVGTWYLYSWDRPQRNLPKPAESEKDMLERFNLVKNPGFEQGNSMPEGWTCATDPPHPGIIAGFDEPGRAGFGRRCVRLQVPQGATRQWRGWHQSVAVQPQKTYLLRAWIKSQDLVGSANVHVHLLTANGSLCRDGGISRIGPPIHGTADWTEMSGVFTLPADAATFEIHLTMDETGTLWHDELALTQIVPASSGLWEGRPLASSNDMRVWPVPAVVKVFPDDPAPLEPAAASIQVARNEREPLQLAVRRGSALKGLQIEVDSPVGPGAARLEQFSVAAVGYVPVDHATSYYHSQSPAWHRKYPTTEGACDGWRGWWPDPLLPRNTLDLESNFTQAFWVTFSVAKGKPAGTYRGRIRLVHQKHALAEIPVEVRVWNFTLPERSHVTAIYDARLGPGARDWGEPPEKTLAAIQTCMAANRLCPDAVQSPPDIRYEHGQVICNYSEFDRAAEQYFNVLGLPHSYTPWLFYGFGWGHPPKPLFGENPYPGEPPYKDADRSQLRPEYKKVYQACLKAFWDHLKAKGWEKKFLLYISDEPFDAQPAIRAQMKALCDMVHQVDPQIPIYSSTWHHVPEWDGYLNVWGIGHYGVVSSEKMARLRADGARVWFTTDGQMCTDTPYCAVERLLPHYCFKYGVEAYEFWGVAWQTYDPYRFGWHAYIPQSEQPGHSYWIRYPNGDGFLLYPGKPIGHDGPVRSIRFEQAREGVEDYEYLYLLRQRIDHANAAGLDTSRAAAALENAQRLVDIPNAGGRYSSKILPDPQAFESARRAVAEALETLQP